MKKGSPHPFTGCDHQGVFFKDPVQGRRRCQTFSKTTFGAMLCPVEYDGVEFIMFIIWV